MSAMYAVMKMFSSRQDSYIHYMQELQRAQTTQRRLRGCVCRHQRAVRVAQNEIGNFMTALDARQGQFVHAVAERDTARAELHGGCAKRDDVICLAENREAARIRTVF